MYTSLLKNSVLISESTKIFGLSKDFLEYSLPPQIYQNPHNGSDKLTGLRDFWKRVIRDGTLVADKFSIGL